jgi:hypothetical protein
MSIQPGVGYTFKSSSQGITLNIEKPWAPWVENLHEDSCFPFRVKNVGVQEGEGGSSLTVYEICTGKINNLTPQVFNAASESWQYMDALSSGSQLVVDFNGTTSSIIFLRVGQNEETFLFPENIPTPSDPDDFYPRIYSTGLPIPPDNDEYAYLQLAKIVKLPGDAFRVDQYVTGSLWADRIKLGTLTAKYYYARI